MILSKPSALFREYRIYRLKTGRNLAEDALSCELIECTMGYFEYPIWEFIEELAYRYFRRFGGTYKDWNKFCSDAAYRISGNPANTFKRLRISCEEYLLNEKIRFNKNGTAAYPTVAPPVIACAHCNRVMKSTKFRDYCLQEVPSIIGSKLWWATRERNRGFRDCRLCNSCFSRFRELNEESKAIARDVLKLKKEIKNGKEHNQQYPGNSRRCA